MMAVVLGRVVYLMWRHDFRLSMILFVKLITDPLTDIVACFSRWTLRERNKGFFLAAPLFLCRRALQQGGEFTKVVGIQVGYDPVTHATGIEIGRIKTSVSRKSNGTVAVS